MSYSTGVLVLTTHLQVTVVDRHISKNVHVAPGPLRVVVRVTALVAYEPDLGDELLVLAEGCSLGGRPLQTGVASKGNSQVTSVVDAIIRYTFASYDLFRGQSGRDKVLTLKEKERVLINM